MDRERAGQLVEAGMWLQLTGDLEGARRLFEQALVLDPGNARARELVTSGRPSGARPQPAGHGMAPPRSAVTSAQMVPRPAAPQGPPPPPFQSAPPAARTPPMGVAVVRPPSPAVAPPRAVGTPSKQTPIAPDDASITLDLDVTVEEPVSARTAEPPAAPAPRSRTEGIAPAVSPMPPVPPVSAVSPGPWGAPSPRRAQAASMAPTSAPHPSRLASHATSAWDSASEPGVHISQVTPGLGDAMDLVVDRRGAPPVAAPSGDAAVRSEVQALMRGARDLLELDDHSGAMELILKAQALSPNDPEVQTLRERSEAVLLAMYESRLGPMSACPRVVMKDDEIIWLNFDHRAGFVLAQIDGTVRFEDLFEVCGMSRIDTARILAQLVDEGVISSA